MEKSIQKVLITGGAGRLGCALRAVFPDAAFPARQALNITDPAHVAVYVREMQPDLIVHAAAFTNVAAAQQDRENCWHTNVSGTESLVSAITEYTPGCKLVYISTACVFSGEGGLSTEETVPAPKNYYGMTKLVGEHVARRAPDHLIIRTNFAAYEPWPYPRAFTDRFGTYLFAHDVAAAIRTLTDSDLRGVVHVAGRERMSMFDLARLTSPDVLPMTMAETALPLTIDMSLASSRIEAFPITRK